MEPDSLSGQVVRLPRRPAPVALAVSRLDDALLREVFPARPFDPAAMAFVLCILRGAGPVLWVQSRASWRENGRPYAPGLAALGMAAPVLWVEAGHPRDALRAMEEGAGCAALSAVVGEIHGAPAVLDMTATKRLSMQAEASGVPVWLIRSGDPGGLSAARMRWRVGAQPSEANPHDLSAPGAPLWEAELTRARGHAPGRWVARHERGTTDGLRLDPAPRGGARATEVGLGRQGGGKT